MSFWHVRQQPYPCGYGDWVDELRAVADLLGIEAQVFGQT